MTIIGFFAKLILKLPVLLLLFLLRFVWFIAYLLTHISGWIISPVILFVLGCGIYCVVKARWTDVFLLTMIEMGLFAIACGAVLVVELMDSLCEKLSGVLAW